MAGTLGQDAMLTVWVQWEAIEATKLAVVKLLQPEKQVFPQLYLEINLTGNTASRKYLVCIMFTLCYQWQPVQTAN